MRKLKFLILMLIVCMCVNINSYAEINVEIVPANNVDFTNIEMIDINGLKINKCNIAGEEYLYNTYANNPRLAPYDAAAEILGDRDYVRAGDYYIVRNCEQDKAFAAYFPVNTVDIYDDDFNLIHSEDFGGGVYVTDIGYCDGVFYCEYKEKYKIVIDDSGHEIYNRISDGLKQNIAQNEKIRAVTMQSFNGIDWKKTENSIPVTNAIMSVLKCNSTLSNKNMKSIIYENGNYYENFVSLGNWFVASEINNNKVWNDICISNDNVYYSKVKLDPTSENIFRSTLIKEATAAFGNNGKLYMRLSNSAYYLVADEEELQNELQKLKLAPYIEFNRNILGFENPPVIENGRILVPMRFLFEQMGADVDWNPETQTATATLDNTAVTFAIDDTEAEVNSQPVTMDVPAQLVNGKTMVPLRFLSEELGFTVTWDEETRTAVIE